MAGLQCWNCWGKGGFRCRWGRVKGVGYDQKRKYLLLCLQALSLWALWHGICVRFKQEAKVSRELLSGASVRVKRERTAAGLHPWWNHRVKFIHNEKPGGFKRFSLRKNENSVIIYSPAWRSKSVRLLQRVLQSFSLQLVPTGIEAFRLIDNAVAPWEFHKTGPHDTGLFFLNPRSIFLSQIICQLAFDTESILFHVAINLEAIRFIYLPFNPDTDLCPLLPNPCVDFYVCLFCFQGYICIITANRIYSMQKHLTEYILFQRTDLHSFSWLLRTSYVSQQVKELLCA